MRRTILDHTPDGLRRRLADMERQIADLQRIRNPPATYVEQSGGVPFVIAAANAPALWKEVARWQCDQTDDAPVVQGAIDAVGNVLLSPGDFYFPTSGVSTATGGTLRGSGRSSRIYGPDGAPAVTASDHSVVEGIRFNYYGSGAGSVGVEAGDHSDTVGCWFEGGDVGVDLASSVNARIVRCDFLGYDTAGVTDTDALRAQIDHSRFHDGSGSNAMVLGGTAWLVGNNHFTSGDVIVNGDEFLVVANHFWTGATFEFSATAQACAFAENFFYGAPAFTDNGVGTQRPTLGNYSSTGAW